MKPVEEVKQEGEVREVEEVEQVWDMAQLEHVEKVDDMEQLREVKPDWEKMKNIFFRKLALPKGTFFVWYSSYEILKVKSSMLIFMGNAADSAYGIYCQPESYANSKKQN